MEVAHHICCRIDVHKTFCIVTKHQYRSSGKKAQAKVICGYSGAANTRKNRLSSSTISHPEKENALPDSWTDTGTALYRMVMPDITGQEMTESDADAGFMPDVNSSKHLRIKRC